MSTRNKTEMDPKKRSLSMLHYDVSRGQSYGKHCRNALYGRLQEASQPQFAPAGPLIINYNHAPGSLFFHVDPKQNRDGPEKNQARNTLLWTYNDVLARFACILRVLSFHAHFFFSRRHEKTVHMHQESAGAAAGRSTTHQCSHIQTTEAN